MYSWGIKGFDTTQDHSSKTTLITSCVVGTGVNPPYCKMDRFFLRSLALSIPIYRNFQSNGVKWRSIKLRIKKSYVICYYIKFSFQSLISRHLTPFDWKCLQIGILRAKDLRKNVFIFRGGGSTPGPSTLPEVRVVLLRKTAVCQIL